MNTRAPTSPEAIVVVDQILRACADYVRTEREALAEYLQVKREMRALIGPQLARAARGGASWRVISARVDLPLSTTYQHARPYLTDDTAPSGDPCD